MLECGTDVRRSVERYPFTQNRHRGVGLAVGHDPPADCGGHNRVCHRRDPRLEGCPKFLVVGQEGGRRKGRVVIMCKGGQCFPEVPLPLRSHLRQEVG